MDGVSTQSAARALASAGVDPAVIAARLRLPRAQVARLTATRMTGGRG